MTPQEQFEHWPLYEEITEKYYQQRYYYGEAHGDKLLTGRIVRWYRTFNGITLTPIQPIVRFHRLDGGEGKSEYVELGATEKYWIAAAADDLHRAWQKAQLTNTFPRPHRENDRHPANPFYVDPAHFLLVYGEPRDGKLLFGRVVGWDPPEVPDELPNPMVRLYRDDGSLDPEPLYVGTLHQPQNGYWIERSEQVIREKAEQSRVRLAKLDAERARARASRPSRTMAEIVPVWGQVIEAASRLVGPHAGALGRQATLTAVDHDTLVVTMNSRELGQQMLDQQFTFAHALKQVLGGTWEVEVLLADGEG